MPAPLSRRSLLASAPIASLGLVSAAGARPPSPAPAGGPTLPFFPSADPALAQQIVGLAHAKFDELRKLVEPRPALAKAAYDWGFGDWETALGAASHVGNRQIAEFLISLGARPDLFTFAMLGNLNAVRAAIEASPGLQRLHGPHGITLLKHAQAGGEQAAPVVEYLRSLGDADIGYPTEPLDPADRDACIGTYAFGPHESDRLDAAVRREDLYITRAGGSPRRLSHTGALSFLPVGAPKVAVKFIRAGAVVTAIEVHDPDLVITAQRV